MNSSFYKCNNLPQGAYLGSATVKLTKGKTGVVALCNPTNSGMILKLNSIKFINLSPALVRHDAYFCGTAADKLKESKYIDNRVVTCPECVQNCGKILYSSNTCVESGKYFLTSIIPAYESYVVDLDPTGVDSFFLPGSNLLHSFSIMDDSDCATILVLFVWDETPIKD